MVQTNNVNPLFFLKSLSGDGIAGTFASQNNQSGSKLLHTLYNIFCKLQPQMHALKKKKHIKNKYLLRKALRHRRKLLRIQQQGPNSVRNIIGEF